MMKSAVLYMRNGKVLVCPQAKTEAGFYIGHGTISVLDMDEVQGIGAALVAALEAFRTSVPTPPRDAKLDKELYFAAGVRSWSEFVRGAKLVSVDWGDGMITLTPYKNMGVRENFTPLENRARAISDTSSELGNNVIAAFADAE